MHRAILVRRDFRGFTITNFTHAKCNSDEIKDKHCHASIGDNEY